LRRPRSTFHAKSSLTGGVKSAPATSVSVGTIGIVGGDLDSSAVELEPGPAVYLPPNWRCHDLSSTQIPFATSRTDDDTHAYINENDP